MIERILISSLVLFFGAFTFLVWARKDRRYLSSKSVASAYDDWTNDQLLENLWGEHVHLGHYGLPPKHKDFRKAKESFVYELAQWSGLSKLPPGSNVLDVGCGIGGSARILAKAYGFNVLGISISSAQIARAESLSSEEDNCSFKVMDALNLQLDTGSFDAVWSVEVGPHIPDKQRYADELLRVLRPGGVLAVADWNRRDSSNGRLNLFERVVMNQLLNQWAHPEFSSIKEFRNHLNSSAFSSGAIQSADWTIATLPSWTESIWEGVRRPGAIISLGPKAFLKAFREVPTILLMRWSFGTGLMQFGVFRTEVM